MRGIGEGVEGLGLLGCRGGGGREELIMAGLVEDGKEVEDGGK